MKIKKALSTYRYLFHIEGIFGANYFFLSTVFAIGFGPVLLKCSSLLGLSGGSCTERILSSKVAVEQVIICNTNY